MTSQKDNVVALVKDSAKVSYAIDDPFIEREISICAIEHTKFYEHFNVRECIKHIKSKSAKILLLWCCDYFDKYGEAPGQQIQDIYWTKKAGLDEDTAEWIEYGLSDLSDDKATREQINPKAIADTANEYCRKLYLEKLSEEIRQHAETGDLEEAHKLIEEYDPPTSSKKLADFVLPLDRALEYAGNAPKRLMGPWLRERSLTLIYGNTGAGKSWLTYMIAKALTRKNYDEPECEIGAWQVRNPAKVLFIDGEVGPHDIGKSFNSLRMGPPLKGKEPIFVSSPMLEEQDENPLDLTKGEHQRFILKILNRDPEMKVIVLDNEANLFGKLENENDSREWLSKVGNFLKRLRAKGVACILVHDSGKSGDQRGSSARAFIMNTIIHMTSDKTMDVAGEVHSNIRFEKIRRHWGDAEALMPFSLHIIEDYEHPGFVKCYTSEAKISSKVQQKEERERRLGFTIRGFLDGNSKTLINKQLGVSTKTFNEVLSYLRNGKFIVDSAYQREVTVTPKGSQLLEELEEKYGDDFGYGKEAIGD